jgi:hypothetical protein
MLPIIEIPFAYGLQFYPNLPETLVDEQTIRAHPSMMSAMGIYRQLQSNAHYRYLRCVQMHDLPTFFCFVQDDSSSIEEPWSIVEMKGRNCYVSEQLYSQFLWLNVHVWSSGFSAAYLLEHGLESLLEFSTAVGTLRHRTRIEDRGIVIERESEMLPI